MATPALWSSSQVRTLLLDIRHSQAPTESLKVVVPEAVRLAPEPDADSDEDHYGDGDGDATVCKLSTYLTIGYAALIGTNREPEDGQSYVGASGPQTTAFAVFSLLFSLQCCTCACPLSLVSLVVHYLAHFWDNCMYGTVVFK